MMKKVLYLLMFLPALVFSGVSRGEKFERRVWKDRLEKKIERIRDYTSKEFQAVCFLTFLTPLQNRYNLLEIFQQIPISSYQLANMKVTSGENSIVVTYKATFNINIEGEGGPGSPLTAICMSVWKKYGDEWKWVGHSESFLE
jgi:hypothetical protein